MTTRPPQEQEEEYNVAILVHGSWHTGEAWNYVKQSLLMREELTTRGNHKNKVIHEVLTPNLIGNSPGRYRCVDPMVPPSQFGELSQAFSKIGVEVMARQIVEIIREKLEELMDNEDEENTETTPATKNIKFHLVAHSAGGVYVQHALSLIQQDAELLANYGNNCHELIESVTFVAAFMVEDGKTLLEYVLRDAQQNSCTVTHHMITPFENSPFCSFNTEHAASTFYNKVQSESMKQQAISNLVFQSCVVFAQPVNNGLVNYEGKVTYVSTSNDNAITKTLQTSMLQEQRSKSKGIRLVEIDSDHSPMLSATQELVQVLLESF